MKNPRNLLWLVLLIAVASSLQYLRPRSFSPEEGGIAPGTQTVQQAFEPRSKGKWLESTGQVVKLLKDDLKGSRHQRFIVKVPGGLTVLISHNIDLAPRLPLQKGCQLSFRGRYEWNEKGGVVHWTHRDPQGRINGGWIECRGKRYR